MVCLVHSMLGIMGMGRHWGKVWGWGNWGRVGNDERQVWGKAAQAQALTWGLGGKGMFCLFNNLVPRRGKVSRNGKVAWNWVQAEQ